MNDAEGFLMWFALKYPEEYITKFKNYMSFKEMMETRMEESVK